MAVSLDDYRPFDSGLGSDNYAEDWRKWMRRTHDTGVISFHKEPNSPNELQPFADSTGMQVKIRPGEVFIQGHWGWLQFEKTMLIQTADPTLARIDRVVARADFRAGAEQITLEVLTGVPAASPTAPTLTNSSEMWEIPIARVAVGAGVTTITAANVTDERDRIGLGMTSSHHAPVLTSSGGGAINMGTGSTSICRWRREGHLLYIRYYFAWGTAPYDGKTGYISTRLPAGFTSRRAELHMLTAHLWTTDGGDKDFLGHAEVFKDSDEVIILMPRSTTEPRLWRYAIAAGGGWPKCPDLGSGVFPEGGHLVISGVIEVNYPGWVEPTVHYPTGTRINLLDNGSFASNLDGWKKHESSPASVTLTRLTGLSIPGTSTTTAARLTNTSGSNQDSRMVPCFPVAFGGTGPLKLSAKFRRASGGTAVDTSMDWYDECGTFLSTTTGPSFNVSGANVWTDFSWTGITVPSGAVTARPVVGRNPLGAGLTVDATDIYLEK